MTKIKMAKELMEAAGVMLVVAVVATFLSAIGWIWVAILFWPEMPFGRVMAYSVCAIWIIGMAYSALDILDEQ